MTERGLLIVFSGPSGVGKDTVLKAFAPEQHGCVLSVSATTRPARPGEIDGQHYHFVSREAFQTMIEEGQLLEYAQFAGNCYGTPAHWVEQELAAGKHVILEIELRGAEKIKAIRPEALFVFLTPPSMEALGRRLRQRATEDEEGILRRLEIAKTEIRLGAEYDFIIVNHTVEESCRALAAVIEAAPCLSKYNQNIIREVWDNA